MGDRSAIEWTDATWNPVRGCTRVSEGCRHCYAERVAARFADPGQAFHGFADRDSAGSKWTGKVDVAWPLIDLPIRWRRPRRIFVNSMSDLFHEALPMEEIATILAVAVAAVHLRGHTFQILTKRAARMRAILTDEDFWQQLNAEAGAHVMEHTDPLNRRAGDARATLGEYGPNHPPPGLWFGVSVENQDAADERIMELRETPAALRFLSCEPLFGRLNLKWVKSRHGAGSCLEWDEVHGAVGQCIGGIPPIDWVIAGGESGPGARPMHPDWVRKIRDDCHAAEVPFFFKQWGEFVVPYDGARACRVCGCTENWACEGGCAWARKDLCTACVGKPTSTGDRVVKFHRAGKRTAGRLLDGRTHDDMPRVA